MVFSFFPLILKTKWLTDKLIMKMWSDRTAGNLLDFNKQYETSFHLILGSEEVWRLWPPLSHDALQFRDRLILPVQEMSISLPAHSASPSDLSTGGGVGVLRPWKSKPPTGMTVSSLPSSNLDPTHTHTHTHTLGWRVGVECQISACLTGGGPVGPDGSSAPAEDPGVWDSYNNTSWSCVFRAGRVCVFIMLIC